MTESEKRIIEVTCPCCQANLEVDTQEALVVRHQAAKKDALSFDDRLAALDSAKEEREDKFAQIEREEKARQETSGQRFSDLLEKAQEGPVEKPVRDIDLD